MKLLALTFALLLTPFLLNAEDTPVNGMPSGLYNVDDTHASITWKVSHLGLSNYTARFTKFDIDMMFDAQDPVRSKVIATIDPTSIRTDYPYPEKKDFDAKLVTDAAWFNTDQFPEIKFRSKSIEKTSEKTGTMMGDVTFLGVTKPVTLDVTFNKAMGNHPFQNKPALGFSATGSLKRSDFGMKTYIPQISDMVDIIIEAEFLYAK